MRHDYHQRWRGPLRSALDAFEILLDEPFNLCRSTFKNPELARLTYGQIIGDARPAVRQRWFKGVLKKGSSQRMAESLRLETHLLAMYTSCGWF